MAKLLEGGIADIVYKSARSFFLDATLSRDTRTTGGTPFEPSTIVTTATYSCKAIEDQYDVGERGAGLVAETDIKILVLANSLSVVPQPLDRITIRGKTVTIVPADSQGTKPVSTDPARATWSLRCRS